MQQERFFFKDVSAVLTSNFIFIDHRLFCSISTEAAEGHLISSGAIKVDNMSQCDKSFSASNAAGFSEDEFVMTHVY